MSFQKLKIVIALIISTSLLLIGITTVSAAPTSTLDLRSASTFSALGLTVSNTGPNTSMSGDFGITTGSPTGSTLAVSGTSQIVNAAANQAMTDIQSAYNDAISRPSTLGLAGDLAGVTLLPGVYSSGGAAISLTTTLSFDAVGDSNAVFIIKIGGALSTAATSNMILVNGARAQNIFWVVGGAVGVGATAHIVGTIISVGALSMGDGATINGRTLTSAALNLYNTGLTGVVSAAAAQAAIDAANAAAAQVAAAQAIIDAAVAAAQAAALAAINAANAAAAQVALDAANAAAAQVAAAQAIIDAAATSALAAINAANAAAAQGVVERALTEAATVALAAINAANTAAAQVAAAQTIIDATAAQVLSILKIPSLAETDVIPEVKVLLTIKIGTIYFNRNTSALDHKAYLTLSKVLNSLRGEEKATLKVTGFSDTTAGLDNSELSLRRAKTVATYLRKNLVSSRISANGAGVSQLATSGKRTGQLDRRVEIWISSTK